MVELHFILGVTILEALSVTIDLTAAVFTNLVDLDCVKSGATTGFRFFNLVAWTILIELVFWRALLDFLDLLCLGGFTITGILYYNIEES